MREYVTDKQRSCRQLGCQSAYLASCALHDAVPVLPADMDWEGLYKFCRFHSITAVVAMALDSAWKLSPVDPEVMKKWREARDRTIRNNLLLNVERKCILKYLESIGCWYMPLKGSLLQYDYPRFGMRQMGDNDILFDEKFQTVIHDFMLSQGYEAVEYQKGNHDEYVKKPVYNMEMHKGLFMESAAPQLFAYYRDVKSRMIKDPDNAFGYHFSAEDFYIYLIAHGYKHYIHSGIGIRNLMDVYVYGAKYAESLNRDYINTELQKIGASVFESECRLLGEKLFAAPVRKAAFSEQEWRTLDIYFSAGTFGTEETAMENALRTQENGSGTSGKLRYLLRRLFPSVRYMIDMEPWLEEKRWLIPLAYVRRIFRGIFGRFSDISREISLLRRTKTDK